jgi:hypothetical protein
MIANLITLIAINAQLTDTPYDPMAYIWIKQIASVTLTEQKSESFTPSIVV